jgi:hypothetical protein
MADRSPLALRCHPKTTLGKVQPGDMPCGAVKSGDPSSTVCVSAANCAFAGCWMLNQPVPSFLRSPPHARGKR